MSVLLDPPAVALALKRMAGEIVERGSVAGGGASRPPFIIGIRRGGEPLAKRIADYAAELLPEPPPFGVVDITLYRDDAATALPNPRIGPSRINGSIDGRRVVLVDDVLHTGRTIRAAFDALFDFGRPRVIELCVLIDRGGRELPIQPDYVGLRTEVPAGQRVEVIAKRTGPGVADEAPWAMLVPRSPASIGSGDPNASGPQRAPGK
jgi:pyrimidine operon attenuation protein/uracil phosphoribosyltransferase